VVLERLFEANVNGLTKGGASFWDVLDLHPKLLDLLNYQSHHVALIAVKDEEWDAVIRSRFDIRSQDLVNPYNHNRLVHPCIFLAAIAVGCRVHCKLCLCNAAIWLPLKNYHQWEHCTIGGDRHRQSCPLVVVIYVWTWIVFFPTNLSVHFALIAK
jgi:hypothetical protein